MEKITLTHAEVIPFVKSEDILREFKTKSGDGKILNFNVKTRINDKIANSPLVFRRCTIFVANEEEAKKVRSAIQLGNKIEITGSTDRQKGKDEKYYDSVKVLTILPLTNDQPVPAASNDLPF